MKRWLAIVGLVVLTSALVFLNQGMKKAVVPDHDEDAAPVREQKAGAKTAPIDLNTILSPEEAVGNPATAKHHIEVGWIYDETNQQNPETLAVPIQAIRDFISQNGSDVSAEIVNLDIPLEDRSPAARTVTNLGLRIDQEYLYGGNLSSSPISAEAIGQALKSAIHKK